MAGATVIVGASHAGVQTAASLRDNGYDGKIVLISDEAHLPYHRPPLSKALASEAGPSMQALRPERFFSDQRIEFVASTRIVEIALSERRVVTASGQAMAFETLVLATGARPLLPPIPGRESRGVLTLRDLDDAVRLGAEMRTAEKVVVIGAGMIGLEFAAVASKAGRDVIVIEAGPRVLGRAVTAETARHIDLEHRRRGVRIVTDDTVTAIFGDGRVRGIETRAGLRLPADLVLIAVGVAAQVEIAAAAGLGDADGVHVDGYLATAAPGVFGVGDCARHPNPHVGATVRIESVQNATDQGRTVAATIAGRSAPYAALPWFWSDQYDLKLQIAGATHGYDQTVSRMDESESRSAAFCFRQGRLVGVETINNAREHMAARRLLGAGLSVTPEQAADHAFDIGAMAKQMAAAE